MGSRNRDRWSREDWRGSAATVDRMIDQGWVVMSACGTCRVVLKVNLAVTRRLRGGGFSLWNRTTPCKVVGCAGVAHFVGVPPGLGRAHQIVLNAEWPGPRRHPPGQP